MRSRSTSRPRRFGRHRTLSLIASSHEPSGPIHTQGVVMSRITMPDRDEVPSASQSMLDAVEGRFGFVPNLFLLTASSPATLSAITGLAASLQGALDVQPRQRIALAVSQVDTCRYCLASHTA